MSGLFVLEWEPLRLCDDQKGLNGLNHLHFERSFVGNSIVINNFYFGHFMRLCIAINQNFLLYPIDNFGYNNPSPHRA